MQALRISEAKQRTRSVVIRELQKRARAKIRSTYSCYKHAKERARAKIAAAKELGIEYFAHNGPRKPSKKMARKWIKPKVTMKLTKKPEIKPEDCPADNKLRLNERQLIQLETLSMYTTVEAIANFFGIARRTLHFVLNRQPEAQSAYRRGRAMGEAIISKQLFDQARTGDMAAISMYLKLKCGWKEGKADIELGLTDPIEINDGSKNTRSLQAFYEDLTNNDGEAQTNEIVINPCDEERELTPYEKGVRTRERKQEQQDIEILNNHQENQPSSHLLNSVLEAKIPSLAEMDLEDITDV